MAQSPPLSNPSLPASELTKREAASIDVLKGLMARPVPPAELPLSSEERKLMRVKSAIAHADALFVELAK